jgi:peptide deformylase
MQMSFPGGNGNAGVSRRILHLGEPQLRRKAERVDPKDIPCAEIQRIIDDLITTMRAAGGAGLAATQIGETVRICVIEVDNNPRYPYKPPIPLTVLVNPTWVGLTEERFVNNEGCLSVPGLRGDVARLTQIRVNALDRNGAEIDLTVRGLSAGTYQHECDHLDGMLFIDKLEDPASLSTWENFERYRRDEYLGRVAELVGRYGQ